MALSRKFKETIKERAQHDPEFRKGLLQEAIELLLEGDVVTGRRILSNYVNATIGYQHLAELMEKNPKSLMRMLSQDGNPSAENMFGMISHLKDHERVKFDVSVRAMR